MEKITRVPVGSQGEQVSRHRWAYAAFALALGLLTTVVGVAEAEGRGSRLAGNDRILTSIAIANEAFPESATTVYLARSDSFPDALAAGGLTDGPILLAPTSGRVPTELIREIRRLAPEQVIALGGEAAIASSVLEEAAGDVATGRLEGPDRFETAVAISREIEIADTIYLSRADNFPDALAAGSLTDGPILLVPATGTVPRTVRDEIARRSPTRVVALGGPVAVSDSVLRSAAGDIPTDRLAGDSRTSTAVEISKAAFPDGSRRAYLAVQSNFPDALAAGALTDGPVLLVPSCGRIPAVVERELERLQVTEVTALGAEGVVCESMLDQAVDVAVPGVTYLDDRDVIESSFSRVRTEAFSIDGLTYTTSVGVDPSGDSVGEITYDLDRDFATFLATIGVDDEADSGVRFAYRIFADDQEVASDTADLGSVQEIEVDVRNFLRLRIEVRQVSGDTSGNLLALGTPRLIAPGGIDDAPRPTASVPAGEFEYLVDRDRRGDFPSYREGRTESLDGLDYVQSIGLDPSGDRATSIWYDLGRDFTSFRTTIGVSDEADSGVRFRWTLRDDVTGTTLDQGTAVIGQVDEIDVDVTDLLRLRLEVTQTNGDTSGNFLIMGTPRLLPDGGSDISPPPADGRPVGEFEYLVDRDRRGDFPSYREGRTESLDGLDYVQSIGLDPSGDRATSIWYDLGRDFTSFRTTIGVSDEADSGVRFQWTLRDDVTGTTLDQGTAVIGQVDEIDVDVTDLLRLRLEVTQTNGDTSGNFLIMGTPRLLPDGGSDLSPPPT